MRSALGLLVSVTLVSGCAVEARDYADSGLVNTGNGGPLADAGSEDSSMTAPSHSAALSSGSTTTTAEASAVPSVTVPSSSATLAASATSMSDAALPDAGDSSPPEDSAVPCVFQSVEVCFNGVDDDCNGDVDCADDACDPVAVCVPQVADSFTLGSWIDGQADCPNAFSGEETALFADLYSPPCTGCACTGSVSCTADIYQYATSASCVADNTSTGGTLLVSLTRDSGDAIDCYSSAGLFGPDQGARMELSTQSACSASGTATTEAPSWGEGHKLCAAENIGGGCDQGKVCVPAPEVPEEPICAVYAGNTSCPAGYSQEGGSWYTDYDDGRSCDACDCAIDTPGNCDDAWVSIYYGSGLTCSAGTHRSLNVSAPMACDITCPECASIELQQPQNVAECSPVAATSGEATPLGEYTVCCAN